MSRQLQEDGMVVCDVGSLDKGRGAGMRDIHDFAQKLKVDAVDAVDAEEV